jgi:hypothetical protein
LVTLAPCAVKLASELSSACTTMPSQWKPVVDFPQWKPEQAGHREGAHEGGRTDCQREY